jgi:hypothetical protein
VELDIRGPGMNTLNGRGCSTIGLRDTRRAICSAGMVVGCQRRNCTFECLSLSINTHIAGIRRQPVLTERLHRYGVCVC